MSFPVPDVALRPALTADLKEQLLDLWVAVSNEGGSVGYTPESSRTDIAKGLEGYFERIERGSMHLVVANLDDRLVASCVLVENPVALQSHFMELKRVMVHPSAQGNGLGHWLVDNVAEIAHQQFGLDFLHIHVRGGENLEAFWQRCDFRTVAVIPQMVKFASGEYRDLVYMQRNL